MDVVDSTPIMGEFKKNPLQLTGGAVKSQFYRSLSNLIYDRSPWDLTKDNGILRVSILKHKVQLGIACDIPGTCSSTCDIPVTCNRACDIPVASTKHVIYQLHVKYM